jgi:2-polyprenyl-3-methyl-5-hydroxy-6-metoxy-1,4-benzoquinol methylase
VDLVEARARGFEAGVRHPWERARVMLADRLIARHVALTAGATVLDVGCGDTFVCETLAGRHPGVHFHAVDKAFTPELIETYRARLSVQNVSLYASLDDMPPAPPASLVLLMDVLEHVPDDYGFLDELCRRPCVDRNTRILITVPSYAWLFASHDRFLGHFRRYSTRTLNDLLEHAGLVALESGHLFTSLLAVRMLQVLRERVTRSTADAPTDLASWTGGEWKARTLANVLTLDGRFALALSAFGLRVPGLSNFTICRKSA